MKLWTTVGGALLSGALGLTLLAPPAQSDTATDARAGAYTPTLKASTTQVVAKKKVELTGRVRPATRGGTVIIQKKIGDRKKWAEESRTTMNGRGLFSYVDHPTTPGPRKYRVVVPASGRHPRGVSDPVKVTVYRWVDLTEIDYRRRDATYERPSAEIDGDEYKPVYLGMSYAEKGSVDWNFDHACLTVRARYGNSDASDGLATANISVVADGAAIYTGSFGLTESQRKVLDVSDAFRVGFQWTSSNPEGTTDDQSGASPVMAEPEALCAF